MSRALRVLALDHTAGVGGAEVALLTAAAGLEPDGVRFVIAAPHGGALEDSASRRGLAFRALPLDRLQAWRPLGARVAFDAIGALVEDLEPDLVLLNGLRSLKACLGLPTARPPVAAFVHDVLEGDTASRSMKAFGFFRQRVGWFLVPATAAREALVAAGVAAARVRVVVPAVEAHEPLGATERAALRAALGVPGDVLLVGFVGQLEPRKGPDVLLDALALRPLPPGVRAIVVGDDPFGERRAYRDALLVRARAQPSVMVTGWRADAARVIAALDVLVCPSRGDACPLVVLQAMGARVPVVASRVGGIPEQLADGDAGVLVPPDDPVALRAALDALLSDPARRAALAAAAWVRHRERFHVTVARGQLADALRSAAAAVD